MADIQACQHCAGKIIDAGQRTCPHCLEPLRTRSFRDEDDLERFREDRRAHGAPVVEDEDAPSPTLALVLGLAAAIMVLAGGAILLAAIMSGEAHRITRSLGQALVPLAMGLGLFEMARRYGGVGS